MPSDSEVSATTKPRLAQRPGRAQPPGSPRLDRGARRTPASGASCFAFAGPGYLVAVGYMDPGNWATDLAGGARYGYTLLSVILHLEPDGHPAAGARGAPRHRQRPRPGAGLPRQLLEAHHARAVGAVRDRDRGVRPGRGDRRRHRAQPALRPPAHLGRLHHGARRADRALPAEQGVPLRRGARRRPHRRHRRLLRRGAVAGASRTWPPWPRVSSRPRRSCRDTDHALHRGRHPRRDRDAAQPVSALVDRADAQVRRHARRASSRRSASRRSTRRSR